MLWLHFWPLSSAVEVGACNPPCTGNEVCQNFSGVPECLCADGFSGEDICTGILDNNSCYDHPGNKTILLITGFLILGNPGATSRDDAIFSGERYFRAKVYFKSWRAPGNLLLPNQFQKWSNSVPLICQKNIFLANQQGGIRPLLELVR